MHDRHIDFARPVDEVLRHVRAYGGTASVASVNGTWLIVKRAAGWHERHPHSPGTVVQVYGREIVIAVRDGYRAQLESDLAPLHVSAELAGNPGKT